LALKVLKSQIGSSPIEVLRPNELSRDGIAVGTLGSIITFILIRLVCRVLALLDQRYLADYVSFVVVKIDFDLRLQHDPCWT
jgi:uncharacterized membrane protein YczE